MTNKKTAIFWIQKDFRLNDNLALIKSTEFDELIPVFIWDKKDSSQWKPGEASQWWLYKTLQIFKKNLMALNSDLIILQGTPGTELTKLAKKTKAKAVLSNQFDNPSDLKITSEVKKILTKNNISSEFFSGNTLCSASDLLKKDGSPYLVYTAFWKNFIKKYKPKKIPRPRQLPPLPKGLKKLSCSIEELELLPKIKWYTEFEKTWKPGEKEALRKTQIFIKKNLTSYNKTRDLPSEEGTSKLSPHLHFGEIHPQRILHMIYEKFGNLHEIYDENIIQFCKEILWREFSYHLLQHFPKTPTQPLRESFKNFPWKKNKKNFLAWTKGLTGYPIVDAGMRQLWTTGWMHNRVRMITASFLIKHLGIHWQEGAKWFWNTLLDADLASNTQGWQWVAGCGADASPFFRIFNPIIQGEKFDPNGDYIFRWCPELKNLPKKWLHKPWEAPSEVLLKENIVLGKNYPHPLVDHKEARNQALWNYETMK